MVCLNAILDDQVSAFNNSKSDKLAMVASTVSSKMLEAMARKEGFKFSDSLTGR